jgi:23S rRNA (uracil1939-C5)-methyltransferase
MTSGGGHSGPLDPAEPGDRVSLGFGAAEPEHGETYGTERNGASRVGGVLSAPVRRTLREGEIPQTSVTCVHSATCPGCPLIDQDYAQQLAAKRARVVGAIHHYPALELVYTSPTAAADPIVGYRTRGKLVVSPEGRIGIYDRSGRHEVVDIPECRVLAPALSAVAAALRALVAAPPPETECLLSPFDPATRGALRALDLREVRPPEPVSSRTPSWTPERAPTSGVLLTFVLQKERAAAKELLIQAARALRPSLPGVIGVAVNLHAGETPQILGPETIHLDGSAHAADGVGAAWHLATFGSFVQAHRDQASRVHTTILREVAALDLGGEPGADRARTRSRRANVLDLYGGSGAIALALAHAGENVLMVESFAPAAQAAQAAAQAQGLTGLEVRVGDAADVALALATNRQKFDAITMNPPRRGISPVARDAIARLGAPLLVYVSCDPDTLARDLDHFARLGYQPGELMPLDMIPLTEEVETIAVLRRAPVPAPLVIYQDHEILVVEKAAHEPVEPLREYASSLLARCARIPGAGALIPVHRTDPGTSGVYLFARSAEIAAAWQESLETTGRLVHLCAAKGITPAKGAVTRDLREGGRAYSVRTRYRRLAVAGGHSVLRVLPEGSRPHQIRRHLAAIGHPVLGDDRYGHLPTNRYFAEKHGLDRPFLHLVRIEVTHPRTGQRVTFESSLPADLRCSVERAAGQSVVRFLEHKNALGDHRNSSIPPPFGVPLPSGLRLADLGEMGTLTSSFPPPAPPPQVDSSLERESAPELDDSPRTLHPMGYTNDDD